MAPSIETIHEGLQQSKWLYEAALAEDEGRLAELVADGVTFEDTHAEVVHQLAADGKERAIELLVQALGGSRVLELRDALGYTPLHVAVQEGQSNVVRKLLELKADVHAAISNKELTALHLVAEYGQPSSSLEILSTLLLYDAAPDLVRKGGSDGDTPLHLAAFNGNAQIVQQMLAALKHLNPPPCVDLKSFQDRTPLHYAAGKGNLESVRLLLSAGADKDAQDVHGATPFHFAARCGWTNVLELLQLDNVDATTHNKMTALHYAACKGHDEVVNWLLAHGASTDAQDSLKGDTPLHLAAAEGHASVVKRLMAGGANAFLANKGGQLALGLADENEHHDGVKEILNGIKTYGQDKSIRRSLWTKHSTENGAALLHYFAGYGTVDELAWIVSLIQYQPAYDLWLYNLEQKDINTKDSNGRNAVHWAAMKSNTEAVSILAKNDADLNANGNVGGETPLSLAVINGAIDVAEEILKWQPKNEDWLQNISTWMQFFVRCEQSKDADILERVNSLEASYNQHTKPSIFPQYVNKPYGFEIPPIYLALHMGKDDMARFLQRHSRNVKGAVNERGRDTRRTALHWATLLQERDIVAKLCRLEELFSQALAAEAEDVLGKTALQYAKEMGFREIEKELLLRSDVVAHVEGLYRDRQLYVDAANAILVGAALISGVTFAGWLQPPLGYLAYYEFPVSDAPEGGTYQSFAGLKQHLSVRMFWIFNSLSFSFGIASMIACLVGVVPVPRIYIAKTVQHLRRCLLAGSVLLGLSIVFVLAAFAAAGFAVLPPLIKYSTNMMITTIVGGMFCAVLLACFAWRLWSIRPRWLKNFEKRVLGKQLCAPPPQKQLSRKLTSTHIRSRPSNLPSAPARGLTFGPRYQNVPWDDGLDSLHEGQKTGPPH